MRVLFLAEATRVHVELKYFAVNQQVCSEVNKKSFYRNFKDKDVLVLTNTLWLVSGHSSDL